MTITVGEMIRLSLWTTCDELVDVDLYLTTGATEGALLARRPYLRGSEWVRRPSTFLADLVVYTRTGGPSRATA